MVSKDKVIYAIVEWFWELEWGPRWLRRMKKLGLGVWIHHYRGGIGDSSRKPGANQ